MRVWYPADAVPTAFFDADTICNTRYQAALPEMSDHGSIQKSSILEGCLPI